MMVTLVAICFLVSLLNHFGVINLLTNGKLGSPSAAQIQREKEASEAAAKASAAAAKAAIPAPSTNAPAK